MTHWCETCGQELPDESEHQDTTWLGAPGSEPHRRVPTTRPSGERRVGSEKKLVLGLAALAAVWLAFMLIGRVVAPDETAEQPPDETYQAADAAPGFPVAEPDVEPNLREAPAPAEGRERYRSAEPDVGDVPSAEAHDAAAVPDDEVDATQLGSRFESTVQVERLQRQLGRRASEAAIAYHSAEGVVVLDLQAGTTWVTELTLGATTADPGLALLRSGANTFAIEPDTLAIGQLVDDSSIVVTDARSGHTFYVAAGSLQSGAPRVLASVEGELVEYITPAGYQLVPLDGLGLVAVSKGPSGDSLIAGEGSFNVLSPHRILTGNATAILEQVCLTPIACELVVTPEPAEGEQWPVPAEFAQLGDQYVLSPNGRSLLRYSPEGFSEVLLSDDGSISWVIGRGMETAAWGPNSDFIAWLDRTGEPKLKVMFPDERDWLTIELADMGAPRPISSELIVFAPSGEVV